MAGSIRRFSWGENLAETILCLISNTAKLVDSSMSLDALKPHNYVFLWAIFSLTSASRSKLV